MKPNLENSVTSKKGLYPPKGGSYTVGFGENLALRIYADSRPHNLKIAQLQKGLVLILNERELVEEGAGFGVPVAVFSDRTCFSGTAETQITSKAQSTIIVKRYRMDTISKKGWKNMVLPEIPIQKFISNKLQKGYRKYPFIRKFFFSSVDILSKIGIKTIYERTRPRGEITVTYEISGGSIIVKASFCELERRSLKKIVVLNEQGSTFFRKFCSSDGLVLVDEQIGAWRLLSADQACFSDLEGSLGFCLRNLSGCRSFIGREHLNGFLAWVGMEYESSPDADFLEYEIKIIG